MFVEERYKEAGEKGKEKLAWACSKLSEVHYDNGSRNLAAKASEEAARVYESMKESHRAIECLQVCIQNDIYGVSNTLE